MHRITDFTLIPVRVSNKTVWQHIVLHSSDGLTGTGEYTVPVHVVGIEKQLITKADTLIGQVVRIPVRRVAQVLDINRVGTAAHGTRPERSTR